MLCPKKTLRSGAALGRSLCRSCRSFRGPRPRVLRTERKPTVNTPHVQLTLDHEAVPPPVQTALHRLNARVLRMQREIDRLREREAEMALGAREREEQLRLASQLQMDLLPAPLTNTDPLKVSTLFLPADHVSGDIYEIARLDENRFGFSIADATGHGLPAALLTILIKNSFRGKEIVNGSYRIIEPDELLGRLNQELTGNSFSHCQFITAVHAIYDRTTNRLRWSRGGAPYPILIRPGEKPRQIQSVGGLMGALNEQVFETVHHDLQPGDIMLFYTDGLENLLLGKQVCGSEGAILQSTWLDQIAEKGPEAALNEIRERVASLKPTDWPQDDITAIAITRIC